MTSPVTVTTATHDDVDRLADLWVSLASEQRVYGSHVDADTNRATVRDQVARAVFEGFALVARDDADPDAPVRGFVTVGVETGAYHTDATRGEVRNLFVRPEYRDEGVGSALLAAAETTLAAAGVDVVALEAMAENEAARRFYERHGYAPHRVQYEKRIGSESDSTPREKP